MSGITLALKKAQKMLEERKNGNERIQTQGSVRIPAGEAPRPSTPGTVQQIMQRYTGSPWTALTDSNYNRQGTPQDLSFWYTYGQGPEFQYFTGNNAGLVGQPGTKPPNTAPNVPGKTPITIPNLGMMGGPLAGLQLPSNIQQLIAQYQGGAGGTGNRTQTMQPVMAKGGPITQCMGLGGLFKKLKKAVKFEGFNAKHMFKDIFHDPQRLLTGAVDPLGTKITNKVFGTDYDPIVNQLGGPTKQRFADAEAHGIDTGLAQDLHKVANTVAGFYGGQALSGLAGNGLENLAYDMPSMGRGLSTAGKFADTGRLGTPLTRAGDMLDPNAEYVYDPGTGEFIPNPQFNRSRVQFSRGGPLSVLRDWR